MPAAGNRKFRCVRLQLRIGLGQQREGLLEFMPKPDSFTRTDKFALALDRRAGPFGRRPYKINVVRQLFSDDVESDVCFQSELTELKRILLRSHVKPDLKLLQGTFCLN